MWMFHLLRIQTGQSFEDGGLQWKDIWVHHWRSNFPQCTNGNAKEDKNRLSEETWMCIWYDVNILETKSIN